MIWLKACPRCNGDLYLDNDMAFSDVVCLQCGHRIYYSSLKNEQSVSGSFSTSNPHFARFHYEKNSDVYSRVYIN